MNADLIEVEPGCNRRPRTLTVLALLMGVALVFSWLIAYALSGALVSAELLPPWTSRTDPRPRWLTGCFVVLMLLFGAIAGTARYLSSRQLKLIDAMEEADEVA